MPIYNSTSITYLVTFLIIGKFRILFYVQQWYLIVDLLKPVLAAF